MDNNNQYMQYKQRNTELLEKIKKENEERMANIMKKVHSYAQVSYARTNEPMDEEKFNEIFKEAKALHDSGVAGDAAAVKKACDLLKKLNYQSPMNRQVEAYLGSTTALLGRDETNMMDRMKLAKRGLKMLDRAVSMAPEDIAIRTLRGHVCYNLPEMYFMRTKCAIEDFNHIISCYEKDNKCIEKGYYCQLLYNLGKAYRLLGLQQDANAAWKKLLTVTKDPKYLELVEKAGYKPE